MMTIPKIKKYSKAKNLVVCPCGGECDCEGEGTLTLPFGMGFKGSKFAIDKIRYKGYYGICEKCHAKVLNYTSKRLITTYPKDINKKLSAIH